MKVKATAAEWTERVRAWRESGRSAPEFAEGQGYSEKLLQWWSGELARRARQKPREPFARVVRTHAASVPMTVAIGGARIEVRAGFDRVLLRDCKRPRRSGEIGADFGSANLAD